MQVHKEFPILYNYKNALRQWRVWVSSDDTAARYDTEWGVVGGKMQTGHKIFKKGNTRSTALEVAMTRANRLWENKCRVQGYSETKHNNQTSSRIAPMLANEYKKHAKKVKFPCYVQPKLDGVRAIIVALDDSNAEIRSRTGKLYNIPHILEAHKPIISKLAPGSFLDGELYIHGRDFDWISGVCRRDDAHKDKDILEFHCFDVYDASRPLMSFRDRLDLLMDILVPICLVETKTVQDNGEIGEAHDAYVDNGYEGVMIRSMQGAYDLDKRSYFLLKLKIFQTDEFECIGFNEGTGKFRGTPIIICQNSDGVAFNVTPEGSMVSKRALFVKMRDQDYGIGLDYTVKFQGLTKMGVPRFPVGLGFRDYE